MEEDTEGEEEVFTEEAVAVDFMEEAEEVIAAVEVSPAAATPLGVIVAVDIVVVDIVVVDIVVVDIVAADIAEEASTEVAASTVAAAVMDGAAGATDGAEEVGVTEEVGAGAGDLALGGRIGDMAGDIRMATTDTAWGITRPTLILTRPTGLRTT